eukprot:CAMPEP_0184411372 /NCGR_PEP_ID=MMETSP0738-20130409/5609_1 /TAXON_ID=385413 /ORGANISM="Thalassiosira miniscula, Strain CCMP1093" /LENGTH=120 /DNA_ID=CAMNT_0026769589 /DNA_START=324 /DNA_END=686 /DNA_ORIENTATION=-
MPPRCLRVRPVVSGEEESDTIPEQPRPPWHHGIPDTMLEDSEEDNLPHNDDDDAPMQAPMPEEEAVVAVEDGIPLAEDGIPAVEEVRGSRTPPSDTAIGNTDHRSVVGRVDSILVPYARA